MNRFRLTIDSVIQLGILSIMGLGLLGAFASWCDGRYQKSSDASYQTASVTATLSDIRESQKELKGEVDTLYLKLIPPAFQYPIRHPQSMKGK